ncbi:MAG: lactate utilization protein [Deltaproteobacteria bacterium]|nr:lactate utilization protein [Deltaproteobacteria bacterium]
MLAAKSVIYERLGKRAVEALAKRNINARYVRDKQEAQSAILAMIPDKASIGIGDSVTMEQVDVLAKLAERGGHEVSNPFIFLDDGRFADPPEMRVQKMRQALLADIFLTGSNAITLDGKIVNIDARGNRVAGIIFGPKKVILAVGANKIVLDVDQALRRIKNVAAPLNCERHFLAHRLDKELPCAQLGLCVDCSSPLRICCYVTIIEWQRSYEKDRLSVFIVGEELGL